MLGMPGTSLSDSALNTAGLPSVKEMLKSSRKAARLFKPDPNAPQPGFRLLLKFKISMFLMEIQELLQEGGHGKYLRLQPDLGRLCHPFFHSSCEVGFRARAAENLYTHI